MRQPSPTLAVRAADVRSGRRTDLTLGGGRIVARNPADGPPAPGTLTADYVAPAFFDLQINGAAGIDFSSDRLQPESVYSVIERCRAHGVGAFCPTLITNSFEALRHGFTTLARCVASDVVAAAAIPVFHLEGPYLSPEDGPRGAHPRRHVRPPDWDEFQHLQEAAGGRIRLVTLAPETEGALDFIERLTGSGVVAAVGHTAASPECIRDAVRAGARLSTHLGNGCHAILPRHPNHLWEQLAADELHASLICDGHHLPPAVVKCIVRIKTPGRAILTCDAGSLAGLPPGRYRAWDQELEVLTEGKIVVAGQPFLAGSWVFTDACIGTVMRDAGVGLADAVAMASDNPRRLLGLPVNTLEPGSPADLVLFDLLDGRVVVRHTIVAGERCGP
jgi:N-acetylglucosamine-6-phosphate deacetylase